VEITDDLIQASSAWESKVNTFFLRAKDLERRSSGTAGDSLSDDPTLSEALERAKAQLHAALSDSFDTLTAMGVISSLITTANKGAPTDKSVLALVKWVTSIVHMFGLDHEPPPEDGIGWSGIDVSEAVKPSVYLLSRLRDEIRQRAIGQKVEKEEIEYLLSVDEVGEAQDAAALPFTAVLSQFKEDVRGLAERDAPPKAYLALCDQLRNSDLWKLGIYLEDREAQPALVRLVDKELAAAREEREAREEAKRAAKKERERQERERLEQGKLDPKDMFKTAEYTDWDADGFPIKDAAGNPIPKNKEKKLRKLQERQWKLHDAWLMTQPH